MSKAHTFATGIDMGFKIDFSELKKFQSQMQITQNEFNDFLRDLLLEMANRIITKTKKKQLGQISEQYTAFDTKTMARAWTLGNIEGSGENISVELLNNTEYATEIEYGHRIMGGAGKNTEVGWYNGRFMLKTSIDEIDRQMPLRYKKAFEKFCNERGLNVN